MNTESLGFRGYISSRPIRTTPYPQRVQNLVVRSYAAQHGLPFKLSFAEYSMPGCYMMMQTLLAELDQLDGIIAFSMFMLPPTQRERAQVYARVLDTGSELHVALEHTAIRSIDDIAFFEDTIQVVRALLRAPLSGRFDKTAQPYPPNDPFAAYLRRALQLY